ncbi:recombinase family protein [Bradyrhizobium sp. C9]|uniref:recombinase family protein n=1 Tax=Bradyrhizobium sp. C9 TaxID=142585 RepID=UPI000BEAD376|nr:recombinase family protein [Bradyrhizobium sp. C9]PDT74247.1 serine recombinase [Bradyrhizobium sp. C9]
MARALVVHRDRLPQSQKIYQAAQYVRMSTDYQQYSIENQAVAIAAYAELHRLRIIRTYRDEGESGLKIENRTGLTELINDVQAGHTNFGHLLIFDVSRWGRFQDIDESAHYEFICRRAGIKVAYCAEQFDNDGGLLSSIVKNIKRVMAAEFSRELSAKVLAGALRLASHGFKMGAPAPYGLERRLVDDKCRAKGVLQSGERKSLTTDRVKLGPGSPDQVAVVKWVFDEYLRCNSQAEIVRKLNRRGVLTNRGYRWQQSAISTLLHNEAYIGNIIYNRDTEKLGARRTHNPRELWIRSEGAIEPIVKRDTFLRAKRVMEERCVRISEKEMLSRIRKVLMKKGKLNASIIRASPGLPSLSSCLFHFGTLRNLYRLIGYAGNQGRFDKLDAHRRWVDFHLENANRLREAFEDAGRCATLDRSIECLRLNNAVNICFRVAKWRKYGLQPLRWALVQRVGSPKGWVVALRMGENNEAVMDYLLLPSTSLSFKGGVFRFSQDTLAVHKIERFQTFEGLSRSLVKRICKRTSKTEQTKRGQLSK